MALQACGQPFAGVRLEHLYQDYAGHQLQVRMIMLHNLQFISTTITQRPSAASDLRSEAFLA